MNHGSFVPFFVRSFHGILIRMSKTEDDDVKEEELRKILVRRTYYFQHSVLTCQRYFLDRISGRTQTDVFVSLTAFRYFLTPVVL